MLSAIDRLVAAGRFSSRSEAVRAGLDLVVDRSGAEQIDRSFADGFGRVPETDEELRDAERLASEAIRDEPWEKWW